MAVDQGTTSSRALLVNDKGEIVNIAQKEFPQHFPKDGWVEHNPMDIWNSQIEVIREAASTVDNLSEIKSIGITNQRETTILWDKNTGEPVYNAIVWQDRRTADYCNLLRKNGHIDLIQRKTGLVIDAYFSGTKIKWILDHVEGAKAKAEKGELLFGTVDTWLIWNITKGRIHATDVTNASRTMLFNIHTLEWDDELLDLLGIPKSILPKVNSCADYFGDVEVKGVKIPIHGVAGDQHAALFGQQCTSSGMVKCTYGTGCFAVMNTGSEPIISSNNLLTTIGYKIGDDIQYALEGSVFIGGAVIQWLRDKLNIIENTKEVEQLVSEAEDTGGVFFVPAFTGLGAPHWDQFARGTIIGITRDTTRAHIARAAVESIGFQVMDLIQAMKEDFGETIPEVRVDGGASTNNFLMQFQSDLLDTNIVRPKEVESTALGVAFIAGIGYGLWTREKVESLYSLDRTFNPNNGGQKLEDKKRYWRKAINRSLDWIYEANT